VIAGASASTAAFFLIIVAAGMRAQRRKVTTGAAGMVGLRVVTSERMAPAGRLRIGDVWWNAVSSRTLEAGTEVEITAVDGLVLRVRPLTQEGAT
jgi:membrane protein implicated in regulation of membrane protease activity